QDQSNHEFKCNHSDRALLPDHYRDQRPTRSLHGEGVRRRADIPGSGSCARRAADLSVMQGSSGDGTDLDRIRDITVTFQPGRNGDAIRTPTFAGFATT